MNGINNKNKRIKIVPVFSGGGTRLPAHIGILQALDELKIDFSSIVGVSGGSIISALYCSGMSINEIKQLALETDFKKFRGYSLIRLFKDGGLSSGDKFEFWMDKQLNCKTFADLPHDLSILATDVNGGGPVIFNKKATPNLKVSKAVRFSMSIPLMFSFQKYQNHILTDGAILSEDALFNDWAGDGTPTVCFRLKSKPQKRNPDQVSLFPLKNYILMLVKTFMTAVSREYVQAQHWHSTIVVDTGDISPVDFSLTVEQKEALFKAGYLTALSIIPKKVIVPVDVSYN
ncbi:patatin-like phospholipase family protein [Catenovulum sp. 2E275]|uniref:patatin-like phospholipase family protein n=1 Tax=Catenovulum sp. 2E275 TaxID=2980497 RepID=UPI0021D1F3E3|nr:patatin-like phospholipase family protein [Catenovulum sp. 2E275]MCU4675568.1 patatin-like phospholipase family protein [Catenovulum sp. 2E275]